MGKELGAYLKNKRRESKITVVELVRDTGVSKSMITYIESGTRDPGFGVMIRYAVTVGVTDLNELFEVYLREQALSVLPELEGTGVDTVISAWLTSTEVLSVDVTKLKSLLDSLDKVRTELHQVVGKEL